MHCVCSATEACRSAGWGFDFRRAIHGHGCTSTVRGAHRKSFVPSNPVIRAQRCERSEQRGAEEACPERSRRDPAFFSPATPPKAAKDERGSSAAQRCHVSQHRTRETLIKSRFPPCTPVYPWFMLLPTLDQSFPRKTRWPAQCRTDERSACRPALLFGCVN